MHTEQMLTHMLWYSPGKPKELHENCFVPNPRGNYLASPQMLSSAWQVLLQTKTLSSAVDMVATVSGHMNKTSLFCTLLYFLSKFSEYFEASHPVSPSQQNLCFGEMMKEPTKIQTDKTYYPCKVLLPLAYQNLEKLL